MINNRKVLAIIPARGGSKRLPRKNVLNIGGKPLISWTIEAALRSKYIDDIFVSTDDKDILNIASQYKLHVPELRPEVLSSDGATTNDVIFYTLKNFGDGAHIVIVLQPTSPLRETFHIDEAISLFELKTAFSVVSVTPCEHPPMWSNILPKDDSLGSFLSLNANKRSQDLGSYYRLNGAIYVYDVEKLLSIGEIAYKNDSYAYKMSNESSVDIDSVFDFDIANFFLSKRIE